MKNLTKLQRNLYNLLKDQTDVTQFNHAYNELIIDIPRDTVNKYYSKEFVFNQGYIKGTPANLSYEDRQDLIIKAGYKQPRSDRAWISFNQVTEELFKAVV